MKTLRINYCLREQANLDCLNFRSEMITILEGAVPMYMAEGAMQFFICGGKWANLKCSVSHSIIFTEISFYPEI